MQSIQQLFVSLYEGMILTAINLAIVIPPLMLLEHLLPSQGARPTLYSRTKSLVFWAVWIVVAGLAVLPIQLLQKAAGLQPLLPALAPDFLPDWAAAPVAALLVVVIGEFLHYWFHRAQHQVPILWRFHSMHHSVRDLHAASGYHHVGDQVAGAILIGTATALLINDAGAAIPYLTFLLGVQGLYQHSATRLNFGPLGYILADNRFHRIHHSIDKAHHDMNYSNVSPLWDVVFRTAYFPRRDEWPETGLEDVPEPETIVDFLAQPLRPRQVMGYREASP